MTALSDLLDTCRQAPSEREKGIYCEELILCHLRSEATHRDLYSDVWTSAALAEMRGLDRRNTGIDPVAKTRGTEEYRRRRHPDHRQLATDVHHLISSIPT